MPRTTTRREVKGRERPERPGARRRGERVEPDARRREEENAACGGTMPPMRDAGALSPVCGLARPERTEACGGLRDDDGRVHGFLQDSADRGVAGLSRPAHPRTAASRCDSPPAYPWAFAECNPGLMPRTPRGRAGRASHRRPTRTHRALRRCAARGGRARTAPGHCARRSTPRRAPRSGCRAQWRTPRT